MIGKQNFKFQRIIAIVGVLLFFIKLFAWYLTDSVAILTDTLESIINVIVGFLGLYSLYLSSLPKDRNHPYGHGKIEFISASIEGTLITLTGFFIIYEAFQSIRNPQEIQQIDYGIYLIAFTAFVNYILGYYAIKKGEKSHSIALIASGKHLQTDTYTTLGIILGLIVLYFTDILWIDSLVAIIFAIVIIVTGFRILRASVSGIMDESDDKLLAEVVGYLNKNRRIQWIDIHNLRIIKYGTTLHIDCHMTVPWYFTIEEGHQEVDALEELTRSYFGDRIELFVHLDACRPYSCSICAKTDCTVRREPFTKQIPWTMDNVLLNKKHKEHSSTLNK